MSGASHVNVVLSHATLCHKRCVDVSPYSACLLIFAHMSIVSMVCLFFYV